MALPFGVLACPSADLGQPAHLSPLEFLHSYLLPGRPVVVTDAMASWPALGKWSWKWLNETLGASLTADELRAFTDRGATQMAVRHLPTQRVLREDYGVPYFLDLDGLAAQVHAGKDGAPKYATGPLEDEYFYYSPGPEYAVQKHIDTGCGQTWTGQLTGQKRWRLWPPHSIRHGERGPLPESWASPAPPGGGPALVPLETTLGPGEMLVFSTGWHHETVASADASGVGSLSLSQLFHAPVPKTFLGAYAPRLLECTQYAHCAHRWQVSEAVSEGAGEAMVC